MNAKENALRIIRFDGPERVAKGCPTHGTGYLGCNHEGYDGGGHHLPVHTRWKDIWGTTWHRRHEGVMGFPEDPPLADLVNDLPRFAWPDPDDERICGRIYEKAGGWDHDEAFLCGSHRDLIWEKSYMLVGMENIMCYLHTDPQAVRDLLHGIMDFQLAIAEHYVKVGVEMVTMSDDLGTQRGLLFSPEIVHEFFVPEYERFFEFYRRHGVLTNFHSCGNITPLVGMFVNLGVSILNPVQATANDLDEVRRSSAGRMALQGGVSSATIVSGPATAIRDEVAQRLWQLGREGGYFCGPDQGMPWPEEHFQALSDAVDELGQYPLQPPGERTN